jgi:hypothetical protein
MNKKIWEAIGWFGALAMIGGYLLNIFGIIASEGMLYALLNGFGAAGIVVSSWSKGDWQPVTLNLFWCAIAVIALLRLAI